jgi:cytochrome P450
LVRAAFLGQLHTLPVGTVVILSQAGSFWTGLVELLLWRGPSFLPDDLLTVLLTHRLQFVLFSNTTDVTRSVFLSQNFRLWLAPGAKELLGDEKNIAFMHGEPHKQIRTRLLPLFSRKALAVYLPIQERLIRHHFSKWLEEHGNNPFSIWPHCRDLNIETSTRVFVGPYVKDLEEVSYHYLMMNQVRPHSLILN